MLISRTPLWLWAGNSSPSSFPKAGSWAPNMRGMDGPVISASNIAVCLPACCTAQARRLVTRDLPTPPLPANNADHPVYRLIGFTSSLGIGAWRDWQSLPQGAQSWVHSDMGYFLSCCRDKRAIGPLPIIIPLYWSPVKGLATFFSPFGLMMAQS